MIRGKKSIEESKERKTLYRKWIKAKKSSSSSSCLNTPQKREMKVKIRRLRRKKDKELSKLASQLIATSTPISFRERGEYSSESEDECGEKVDFLVSASCGNVCLLEQISTQSAIKNGSQESMGNILRMGILPYGSTCYHCMQFPTQILLN